MRLFILFALFACFSKSVIAQTGGISVTVSNTGAGVDAATVSLLHATDSSWIRSDITDNNGVTSFAAVVLGKYLVSASSVGYKTKMQAVEVNEGRAFVCNIILEKESTSLNEVAVTAKKPFIEMSLGKMVVNIEGSTAAASSNVLELMSRLPGLVVDQNGSISMKGKSGILVLIDDRPTYLTGDDLAAYLKTITADETAQIELITQPGAKYDAAGNTGVINIKLRKNKKQGWNGSTSVEYGQGVYFRRNENFMLTYKKNKLSLLLNVTDMEAIGFAHWRQEMYYTDQQGNITGSNKNHSMPKERFAHTTLRLGADYNLSEKTTIGLTIRGAYHPNKMRSYVQATYEDYVNTSTYYNNTEALEGHIRKEVVANAYLSHKFSKDHTLDVNIDGLTFSKNADQQVTTTGFNSQMQPLPSPPVMNSLQRSPISIYSIKADDACTFKNGLKLESGIKLSRLTMDFDAKFSLYENNEWANDTGRSNHFLYKENINAGYITLTKELGKKWEVRAGLRAEQTIASGLQYVGSNSFKKNYVSLFPTAFLNYKLDSSNQFELNYGRRIDRPEYRQLNPFTYYSFQSMYSVGNPDLMPQYTNNIELKHSFKNTIITELTFSGTTDVIQGFLTVDEVAKVSYNKLRNIATNNFVSLSVSFNKDLFKWWSFNASAAPFYATFEGIFGNAWKKAEWSGYWVNIGSRFDLGKGWKAEFYGWYNSGGRWSLTSVFDPIIGFDLGASKKIGDRWQARLFAHDPLYIFRLNAHDYGLNYRATTWHRSASQALSLTMTYTFGSQQTAGKERSMDEVKRL